MVVGAAGTGADREEKAAAGAQPVEAIQRDIERVRDDLVGTLGELNRRLRGMLDVRGQLRRHPVPLALVAGGLAALVAGGIALGLARHRRRQRLAARLLRLREALRRMIDQPKRVATDRGVGLRIAAAAGGAAASVAAKKVAGRLLRAV